jgi:glycosyltransferase involved in cell wall biosynthesis
LWSSRPSVRVILAGKSPARAVRELEQVRPGFVSVTGTLSDLRPHLRRAAAAVAPMVYGVGIQNKVLEAMACATPVIASPQATSALGVTPGEELLVGASPREMSQAILQVLADEPLRRRLGAKGRAYVERRHDWAAIVGKLEQVYAQASQGLGRPEAPARPA